jgi:CHAD domain-containing protein
MSIAPERSQLVFEKTERDLRRLCGDQRPETVHSYRTTTRRLQTLLEDLLPERDRNQKKLLKMLGRIRKRAGKVRDLDVQLSALRSLKIPQEPRRKTQLVQGLLELRAQHERKLCKTLTKEKIREIRKRLRKASKGVSLETNRDPLTIAKEMLTQVSRPSEPLTEAVLHQYRIVVKRARYAAEFAPKSAEGTRFITELKRLQDALGNWHDWLTLTESAAERLGDINQSSLVAAIHNVTGAKFRHAVAAVAASPNTRTGLKTVSSAAEPLRKASTKATPDKDRTSSAA